MQHAEQSTKLWTKSFISLTVCSLLLFLNLQMLLSSFPAYVKNEFSAGDMAVSLVTSVFAASAILARFLTAALLRRIDQNVILYMGLVLAIVITAIYVYAQSIGSLLVMRVGYGIGFGMASTIIPTLVSQRIPTRRMGEGIGYFGLSTSLAMSIGPMIGLNVMNQWGFGTLTMIAATTLFLTFPIIFLSRSMEAKPEAKSHMDTSSLSKQPANHKQSFNTRLLFPALLNVLLSVTYSGLLSFIALFGEVVRLEQVGLFFLFTVFTIILIRPIAGKVFDRMGHAAVLIPAALSVMASLLVLSYATSLLMLIESALLYGLGFGAIQPTLHAWMLQSSSKEKYGIANSMYYNSTDFGVASGALILGAISSVSDYGTMYRYSAGFMLLFLVLYVLFRIIKAK